MMAFFHPMSAEYSKSMADIFHVPPTQIVADTCTISEAHPINSLSTDSLPIEFELQASGLDQIDLNHLY